MSTQYGVVKRLGPGLVVIQRTATDGTRSSSLWDKGKLRKGTWCEMSKQWLPAGTTVYRPTGNSMYRYERIRAVLIDAVDGGGA